MPPGWLCARSARTSGSWIPVETSAIGNVVWCNILATSFVLTRRCPNSAPREIPVGRLGGLRSDRTNGQGVVDRGAEDGAKEGFEHGAEGDLGQGVPV